MIISSSTYFKKHTSIFIFILQSSILAVGYTGVSHEKNSSTHVSSQQSEYQDLAWIQYIVKYSTLVYSDIGRNRVAVLVKFVYLFN